MEIARSGGVMLFIISRIISRTSKRKWISRKWVEKRTLEDIFEVLAGRGMEIYIHCEFGDPWPTFDEDLSLFVDIGWIEVESELIKKTKENEGSKIAIEERVKIFLTERGIEEMEKSELYFPEHQRIIEEVINDIVLYKN